MSKESIRRAHIRAWVKTEPRLQAWQECAAFLSKPQCARNLQGRDASRLDQPRQDRVGKRAGEMGNALGPIVAEAQMRLTHRLEVDRFGSAPGQALFRDPTGSITDRDQIAVDQRVGQRNAKLAGEMTKAGARLAQRSRQPRELAIDRLRLGGEIDQGFDQ